MKILLKVLVLTVTLGSLCILGGCNTMEGVGKDLKQAGGAIEDAAES